jgi:hypothetical protein
VLCSSWYANGGLAWCPGGLTKTDGWYSRVQVLVWVRWGRDWGHRHGWLAGPAWKERRARLYVGVAVTTSMGHPMLECSGLEDVPEGVTPRLVFQTKPECVRKQAGNRNVIHPSRIWTSRDVQWADLSCLILAGVLAIAHVGGVLDRREDEWLRPDAAAARGVVLAARLRWAYEQSRNVL